jgi:hypothetical protein
MDKFDEYKFFAQVTHELSERRQAATQTYLTVNTVISAALGFLVKDMSFRGGGLVLVSLPFFLVGVLACLIWCRIITQYKALAGWRYEQLIEMEQAMPQSYQMYLKEQQEFFPSPAAKPRYITGTVSIGAKRHVSFSQLELWLPRLFLGLYIAYGLGLVVAVALGRL